MLDAIERTFRRVMLAIGRGRICVANDSSAVQTLQVKLGNHEVQDNLPRLAEFGFTSVPPSGADAVLLFLGGDRSNGVVVATGDQSTRPRNLKPGEAMLYSADGKKVHLTLDGGIFIDANGQDVTVANAATATITAETMVVLDTPKLKVTGSIEAGGDVLDNSGTNTSTLAHVRQVYNTHTHGGVQGGMSNTSTPSETA